MDHLWKRPWPHNTLIFLLYPTETTRALGFAVVVSLFKTNSLFTSYGWTKSDIREIKTIPSYTCMSALTQWKTLPHSSSLPFTSPLLHRQARVLWPSFPWHSLGLLICRGRLQVWFVFVCGCGMEIPLKTRSQFAFACVFNRKFLLQRFVGEVCVWAFLGLAARGD